MKILRAIRSKKERNESLRVFDNGQCGALLKSMDAPHCTLSMSSHGLKR